VEQLLTDITGKSFNDLMNEKILGPLEMNQTFYEQPISRKLSGFAAIGHDRNGAPMGEKWFMVPFSGGGAWSTAADLAKVVIEIQRAIVSDSGTILSRESARMMVTEEMNHYGLGVFVKGSGDSLEFNHTGHNEGYRSIMVGYPFAGKGAVILTNAETSTKLVFELLRSIAEVYGWPGYRTIEREVVSVPLETLSAYAGEYEFAAGMNFVVSQEGSSLYILAPPLGTEKVEMFPESESTFFVTVNDVTFTFTKDSQGRLVEMIVQPPDNVVHAKKIK
jgi:CubicO group peptidase (beta-lactamase class C family)